MPLLAPLLALAVVTQTAGPAKAVLHYDVVSEDIAGNRGDLALDVASGPTTAVVWEQSCEIAAAARSSAPDSAEQAWTFRLELASNDAGLQVVRVRAIHGSASAPPNPRDEQTADVPLDGTRPMLVTGFSANTDCRYSRINLSVNVRRK